MLLDFMNSDDARVKTIDFEDDSASRQSNRGVGKHPLLGASDSQPTEPPAKRIRSSPQRISCKARGLSNRHNADNAYLEIPPGAPHGLPLRCSDPECASSGRRFRYCQGKEAACHTHVTQPRNVQSARISSTSHHHSLRRPGSKTKLSSAPRPWNGKLCNATPKRGGPLPALCKRRNNVPNKRCECYW